jgi:AcrR family transcriptional regulator
MTDSATKTPGKRERLVASAADLMHEQGIHDTSLAEIAERADVPLGNVYYYFKTKDDLVAAVVDERVGQINALLARLDAKQTPKARLKGLVRNWADAAPMVARAGCPLGSLCTELAKSPDLADASSAFFEALSAWIEAQFRELGRKDAPDLALMLLSGVQGGALLSNSFHDERIMVRQVRQLDRWIDSIV